MRKKTDQPIYLDYAASTPVHPEVASVMHPYFTERFGNPGSVHAFGRDAMAAVDTAREITGGVLHADFRDIVFTGSATEANNMALRGVVKKWSAAFPDVVPRIVVSSLEHESVLETARSLGDEGAEVTEIPVDGNGSLDMDALRNVIDERTALVSVMYANNELGTVFPVPEIGQMIRSFREQSGRVFPLLHTDAVQAFQFLDCSIDALKADLITLSGHKIYGPKGIGVLYIKGGDMPPFVTGGGQEFGLRSGTENTPLIAGFGKAVECIVKGKENWTRHVLGCRDLFWKDLSKAVPDVCINGNAANVVPGILSIWVPGLRAEELVTSLDMQGVAVSSGSACSARSLVPSRVVEAVYGKVRAGESVRISFGRPTLRDDVRRAAGMFAETVQKLRT